MQVFLNDLYLNETALELSDPRMYTFFQLLRVLRLYALPAVCGAGLLLQLWVIVVCCLPGPTRRSSLQPYLVSLAVADIVFLSMVMLDWVKAADPSLDFYSRKGFCQGMTYISSLCVFVSGWYTCCILLDRYLHLFTSPSTAKYLCTPLKAKFICVSVLAMGVVVYLNISLLYTVYVWPHQAMCMPIVEYKTIVDYFGKVELSLNLGAPYLCILVLLLLSTVNHCRHNKTLCRNASKSPVQAEPAQVRLKNCRPVSSQSAECDSPNFAGLSLATGVLYLVLTFPAYVMHVLCTVYSSEPEYFSKMTLQILFTDQLLQYVFYCWFAFNGLVYAVSEPALRKSTKGLLNQLLRPCRIFAKNDEGCKNKNGVSLEEQQSPTKRVLVQDKTFRTTSAV